jgi:uncharacterized protein (TIGR03435 family)
MSDAGRVASMDRRVRTGCLTGAGAVAAAARVDSVAEPRGSALAVGQTSFNSDWAQPSTQSDQGRSIERMVHAMRSNNRTQVNALRGAWYTGMRGPWSTMLLLLLGAGITAAQSRDEPPRFEVASIVPHADTGDMQAGIEVTESFVRIRNLSLRVVIGMAYGVRDSRLVGPARLDRRQFDVTAKPPAGWDRGQLPLLLRALLAERFKLVVHHEMKEVPGYVLRVQRGGHRMRQSAGARTYLTARPGLIAGNGRTLNELAAVLEQMVGTPVVDETGVTGPYDIRLEWTPQPAALNPVVVAAEPEVSLFTAVREQLGLRLDPTKVTADVVVVDSVEEMPTPN